MNFRVRIIKATPSGRAVVRFDCILQQEEPEGEDPKSWVPVDSGHRTVELQASVVKAIRDNDSLSTPQKRATIANLIRDEVKNWGTDEGAEAIGFIETLIPGWPVNVNL